MSNVAAVEITHSVPVIIETNRGPCLAGRPGLTIYPVFEYLKQGYSRELIRQDFRLTDAELDAVTQYIAENESQVAQDYAEIVRRSEALQARYQPPASLFSPELPWSEKDALLRQELARRQQAAHSANEHHAAA